jgi:hypothetical protein
MVEGTLMMEHEGVERVGVKVGAEQIFLSLCCQVE